MVISLNIIYTKAQCDYTLRVKTGLQEYAGTNSTISVILSNSYSSLNIPDLETWGATVFIVYLERGNLDVFSGNNKPCLLGDLCRVTLISEGTGTKQGWYVEYVEVTIESSLIPSTQDFFVFNQWISVSDPPYRLHATRTNPSLFCLL